MIIFAAPLWLLVGWLALVVLLLHTFRRQRVDVPSTILWRQLTAAGTSRRSIRPPRWTLLLWLQLLVVAILAGALAQPTFGPGSARPGHDIFVLDASASMRSTDVAPSRFAAARAALGVSLAAGEEGVRYSVLLAAAEPRTLFARQSDGEALEVGISGLAPTDGTADWSAVAARLAGIVRAEEQTRVTLLTDGQDDPAAILGDMLSGLAIEATIYGNPNTPNASVSATLAPIEGEPVEDRFVGDGPHTWLLTGAVTIAGAAAPPEVTLRFRPEGGASFLEWGRITSEAEDPDATGIAVLSFEQELELPSGGTLTLSLPPDSGPADNAFSLVLHNPPRRLQVLYLGEGNPPLELALLARDDVDLFSNPTPPAEFDPYDLVIADNVVLSQKPAANVLWVGSGRIVAEPATAMVSGVLPTSWNQHHPLSAGLRWSRVGAQDVYHLPAMPGATALLAARETPLIEARTTGTGREVRLALTLDKDGWAGTPQFPIFLSNLLDWLGTSSGAAGCVAGEPCSLPAKYLASPVLAVDGSVVKTAAIGTSWLLDEANVFVPPRSGLHSLGNSGAVLAVNASPAEVDIRAAPQPEALPAAPWAAIWQLAGWLIVVAAVLLVLEAFLAGRGPERFLRRNSLGSGVPGARVRRWVLGLRGLTLTLALAALAGLPFPSLRQAYDTVLVIDPNIVGDARRPELVAEVAGRGCAGLFGTSVGLVELSAAPRIDSDLSCSGSSVSPNVPTTASARGADIGAALEFAAAMIRPDALGRVVLATDGNETGGGTAGLIQTLVARGIAIDVLPLTDWPAGDNLVGDIGVPEQVVAGDSFPLSALIHSASGGQAKVTIAAGGETVSETDMVLLPGSNRLDAHLPEADAGQQIYSVRVESPVDPMPGNDHGVRVVGVNAIPTVAIITPETERGQYFADALALQGIETELLLPGRAPFALDGWLKYSVVALLNVPAIDLHTMQQEQLEQFARIHGRGLLILGGENTFGPGGYFQTPLEVVSPLSSRVPRDIPVVAIAFVLDRSGSMQALEEGVSRLEIAKQATLSAIELLNDESQVAVVVFDTLALAIVPVQARKDEAAVAAALAPLEPGGGTSIHPGLEEALNQMQTADSHIRHIIVMSDGLSQPGDFPGVVARAAEMDITISAVAIGHGADVAKLEDLARAGGGAFHVTQDFRALPSILSQEAMLLAGQSMETGVRPVGWLDRSADFLTGLPDPMPAIEAYVLTTIKPAAQLHLATEDDAGELVPIMASWRYGNGSVLALATHGAGPGSVRWLQLPQYPMLWSQIVRHFLPTTAGPGMNVTLSREGDRVALIADALDASGEPVAGLTPVAALTFDGAPYGEPMPLAMGVPGRYGASFPATRPGIYTASVTADGFAATQALSITYPAVLDFSRAGSARLEALASATGGRVLNGDESVVTSRPRWSLDSAWRPWVLLALAALMVDLAMRYVPGLFPFLRDRARTVAPKILVPA